MIRKALFTTLLLLLTYSLFITVFRSSIRRTAQTVEQRNTVKAEEFLYENGTQADTVIVGSSMSNRLLFDSLPGHNDRYYNLALEGMASVDGLHLIAHAGYKPKLVLVEINTLDRMPDTTFFGKFTETGWSQIREYVPFMRLKYQPIGVMKALLRDWRGGASDDIVETVDTAFVTRLVQKRLSQTNDRPDDKALQQTIDKADTYIQELQKRGTKLIFFEMPTDPRIRNTNVSRRLRELVDATFSNSAYQHIPYPTDTYQTTDGIHLPRNECIRYTRYLYEQLSQSQTISQPTSTPNR
ncbi:hypothetical protein IC229_03765 [Spirosoma sp. BT702]|uniref:Uncharacterized protein n=1 Tax=Spirosoma profusum TaxID=2771354 RepID=A0A926Y0K5_9BACT|nr:hypothetical protein [Spirosoma profusum]MBD2699740.1 hypothetical protein [Spirosoma profusum]